MSLISRLPAANALLNGMTTVLLLFGYAFIRFRKVSFHKFFMLSGFLTSTLFLVSYITYHAHVGSVHFPGRGWIRPAYFSILISHTFLALVTVPLVLVTVTYAWKQSFARHKKVARWTFPIWIYVSITGVLVYWLLYIVCKARIPL